MTLQVRRRRTEAGLRGAVLAQGASFIPNIASLTLTAYYRGQVRRRRTAAWLLGALLDLGLITKTYSVTVRVAKIFTVGAAAANGGVAAGGAAGSGPHLHQAGPAVQHALRPVAARVHRGAGAAAGGNFIKLFRLYIYNVIFNKLLQLFSTRSDLLPSVFTEELALLQVGLYESVNCPISMKGMLWQHRQQCCLT